MGLALGVGFWEWLKLSGIKMLMHKVLALVGFVFVMAIISLMSNYWLFYFLATGLAFWLVGIVIVVTYPSSRWIFVHVFFRSVFGLFVLLPAFAAFVYIKSHPEFEFLMLFLLAIVCSADIGAFLVGRKWGLKPLAKAISPGKSWAGFYGGIGVSCCMATLVAFFSKSSPIVFDWISFIGILIITTVIVVFSVIGDLIESILKREIGVKDSGSILPGHGGILDRIDSWTAAIPVYGFFVCWMSWPML